jgi:hypothetical protein
MRCAKNIAGASGLILLLIGFLGAPGAVFEIFDPAGSKMADDADPLGTPSELA